jgi:hypothetical protein
VRGESPSLLYTIGRNALARRKLVVLILGSVGFASYELPVEIAEERRLIQEYLRNR